MRKTSRTGVTQRRHATPSRFRVTSPCYVVWCYVFLGGVVAGAGGTRLQPTAPPSPPDPAAPALGSLSPLLTSRGGPRGPPPAPSAHFLLPPPPAEARPVH